MMADLSRYGSLAFSVGEDHSVLEVVALSFVPAVVFVVYVLVSDWHAHRHHGD